MNNIIKDLTLRVVYGLGVLSFNSNILLVANRIM